MNIQEAKTVLMALAKTKSPVAPILWGKHGIAKSAIVSDVAKELGYEFQSLILSQREAVDLLGVMFTSKDEELNVSVTDYHPPKWFARAIHRGKLVLFLDELNRARPEVIKAAFELVNERRLNNTKIKDDVIIVVACNPSDERNDVVDFDEALTDRFMHLHVKPDLKCWLNWAKKERTDGETNISEDILSFLVASPEHAYHKDKRDNELPFTIKHSFRSWERASHIHRLGLPRSLELECLQGIVGPEVAIAFIQSLESRDKPLTSEEIISLKKPTIERLKKYADSDGSRLDILKESVNNLVKYVTQNEVESVKHSQNIIKFLSFLPDDLFIVAMKGIHEKRGWAAILLGDKELKDKMVEINKTLTAASGSSLGTNKGQKK